MIKLFAQITKPDNGYLPDREASQRYIEQDGTEYLYEVKHVEIGRSSTKAHLKDKNWVFNSVNLSFFVSESGKPVREYDIFKNELKMKQIQCMYINML